MGSSLPTNTPVPGMVQKARAAQGAGSLLLQDAYLVLPCRTPEPVSPSAPAQGLEDKVPHLPAQAQRTLLNSLNSPSWPPHLQLPFAFVKGDLRAECVRQAGGPRSPGSPNEPSARLKSWPSSGLSSQREWSSFPTKQTLWLLGHLLRTSPPAFPPLRPKIPSGCFIIAPGSSIPG